jgi:hypothetical protein
MKKCNVFDSSKSGILGIPLEAGMFYSPFFCICIVLCRQRPCDGLIPRLRSPTNYLQDSSFSDAESEETRRATS